MTSIVAPKARVGWICPKCDKGIAPEQEVCPRCDGCLRVSGTFVAGGGGGAGGGMRTTATGGGS